MFDKILAYIVSAFTGFLGINRVHEPSVLPKDFVFLDEIVPQIKQEMMYASSNNFTGDVVRGYGVNRAIVTRQAADAIKRVNDELKQEGLGLLIYDAYRPTKAVGAFLEWRHKPDSQWHKEKYYPDLNKDQLFQSPTKYIFPGKSSHSRGSTLDLTLYQLDTGLPLNMGSPVDFFGHISHTDDRNVDSEARDNRQHLKNIMEGNGFVNYPNEWWHYTLKDEPFKDEYFDFDYPHETQNNTQGLSSSY